jgi:hypothetical protein
VLSVFTVEGAVIDSGWFNRRKYQSRIQEGRGLLAQPLYEGRLQSSWTYLIIPSRNFVEVRWRSLFRSISLDKLCTSYNAPPTSRKRAADRWSLRNFLPRSSLFVVGKAQKLHGARSELYGGCCNGVPPIHFFQAEHRIRFRSTISPKKVSQVSLVLSLLQR